MTRTPEPLYDIGPFETGTGDCLDLRNAIELSWLGDNQREMLAQFPNFDTYVDHRPHEPAE